MPSLRRDFQISVCAAFGLYKIIIIIIIIIHLYSAISCSSIALNIYQVHA